MKATRMSRSGRRAPIRVTNTLTKTLLGLIATASAAHATALEIGLIWSNGNGSGGFVNNTGSGHMGMDIQTDHGNDWWGTGAANGSYSMAIGSYNVSYGMRSVTFGRDNSAWSLNSVAIGHHNQVQADQTIWDPGYTFGSQMSWIPGDLSGIEPTDIAVGSYNFVGQDPYGGYEEAPFSSAFGILNFVASSYSSAFGIGNTIPAYADYASVFGSFITNYMYGSTMIGPNNTAKVTILGSGNVGIGLGDTPPVQKLDVLGNIRLSGSIMKAGGGTVVLPTSGTLTLPAAGGTLVTTSGNQSITGTTTLGGSSAATQTKVDGTTGNVSIGASTQSARLSVRGSGAPVSTTTTPNGLLILSGEDSTNTVLTAGVDNTGGFPYGWLQARHANAGPAYYPLALNPNGGNVGVGTTTPKGKFSVGTSTTNPTTGEILVSDSSPQLILEETDATPENRLWDILADGEQFRMRVINDANTQGINFMVVDRTGSTIDSVTFPNGKVGIGGTTSPQNTLSLHSSINSYNDTGAERTYSTIGFQASPANYVSATISAIQGPTYYQDAADLAFSAGYGSAVERMRIKASGDVGIGVSSPGAKLEVGGNAKINGSLTATGSFNPGGAINLASGQAISLANGGNAAYINSPGSSRLKFSATGNPSDNSFEARPGGLMFPATNRIMDQDSHTMLGFGYIGSGAVNYVQIDNAATTQSPAIRSAGSDTNIGLILAPKGTGNINIPSGLVGINTSATPADYVHIKTSSSFRDGGITLQTYTDNQAMVRFQDSASTYKWSMGFTGIQNDFRLANSGFLHVSPVLTVLDSSGNVGIGTTSPNAKLQVAGDSIFGVSGTAAGTKSITFRADSGAANVDLFSLNFQRSNYDPTGTAASIVFGREANATEGNLSFRTNNGSGLVEQLRITADGRVGVGTLPNATAKMHVSAINTQTSAAMTALRAETYISTAASTSTASGLVGQGILGSQATGSNTGSGVTGITGVGRNDTSVYGLENATGVSGQIWLLPPAGTVSSFITNGKALSAASPYFTTGCSVTNAYALYLGQQKVSGVTNGYGVFQSGASDINYFDGKVGIGVTPTSAKLEVSGDVKVSGGGSLTVNGAPVLTSSGGSFSGGVSVTNDNGTNGGLTLGSGAAPSGDGANLRLLGGTGNPQWNLDNYAGSLRFFTEPSPGGTGTVAAAIGSDKSFNLYDGKIKIIGSGAYTGTFEMVGGGDEVLKIYGPQRVSITPLNTVSPHGKVNITATGLAINTSDNVNTNIINASAALHLEPDTTPAGGIWLGNKTKLYTPNENQLTVQTPQPVLQVLADGTAGARDAVITARANGDTAGEYQLIAGQAGGPYGAGFHTTVAGTRTMTQTAQGVTITGNLAVNGLATKLRVAQQGDIDMGEFTASPTP